jgi:hypothetical protein
MTFTVTVGWGWWILPVILTVAIVVLTGVFHRDELEGFILSVVASVVIVAMWIAYFMVEFYT